MKKYKNTIVITHKTTHIGVHYARFCTYFVGENDDF